MNCSKCSYFLPESAKFCPQCGSKVSPVDTSEESTYKKSQFLDKPRNAYLLIALTSVVALVIVFLILESNQKKDEVKVQSSANSLEITPEINALREKLSSNPDDLQSNIRMGNILFDAGDFAGAIPFYTHATHLDSLNIAIRIDMAVCYYNIQNFPIAIENMEKALELDPNHVKGLFNIGIMYSRTKEKEQARFYWEKLILLHPQSEESIRARQLLEGLN